MPKRAQENRIVLVSSMVKVINRAGLFVLVPIWGSAVWVGVRLFYRNGSHLRRTLATMLFFLASTALSQYLVAATLEAIENEKHMVFASLTTMLIVPTLLAAVFSVKTEPTLLKR